MLAHGARMDYGIALSGALGVLVNSVLPAVYGKHYSEQLHSDAIRTSVLQHTRSLVNDAISAEKEQIRDEAQVSDQANRI